MNQMRDGAEAARETHNLEVAGSSPARATTLSDADRLHMEAGDYAKWRLSLLQKAAGRKNKTPNRAERGLLLAWLEGFKAARNPELHGIRP